MKARLAEAGAHGRDAKGLSPETLTWRAAAAHRSKEGKASAEAGIKVWLREYVFLIYRQQSVFRLVCCYAKAFPVI